MKELNVEVCACTQCVMNGCMDLIESIESLTKLKTQLKIKAQINVTTSPSIGDCKHTDTSPVVCINGTVIEHANSQTVMSQIIALTTKHKQRT